MCGIGGFSSLSNQPFDPALPALNAINRLLAHRGPDDSGTWVSDQSNVGLAHQRLSIIDLSEQGSQPMHAKNGTSIVLNGEIYNYLELRESLASGWEFASHSDTETILAAYARYGQGCLDQMRECFLLLFGTLQNKHFFVPVIVLVSSHFIMLR